eukprot:1472044-Prymnesium_polylepis.1
MSVHRWPTTDGRAAARARVGAQAARQLRHRPKRRGARTGLRIALRGGAGPTGWDDGAGALPRGYGPPRPLHRTVFALRETG